MPFNARQTKWLKGFHLLAVSGWAGGALSLAILHFLRFKGAEAANDLHGIDRAAHLIDMGIIVGLGATGCLITGLLYSLCTNWGFFRHKWVAAKWIVTLFCVLAGTFALGPWEKAMVAISGQLGGEALSDAKYLSSMHLNFWGGILQIALIVFMIFISVFKPWKPRKTKPVRETPNP